MDPNRLDELLGSGHNVPWARIVAICHEFDQEAIGVALQLVDQHQAECPAHQLYQATHKAVGSPEWLDLRNN